MKAKTTTNKGLKIDRKWHLVDLAGQNLGRSCTKIANLLTGKSKPTFSFQADEGDYVIVINAEKVATTGRKLTQKLYQSYTGFAGGLKEFTLQELLKKDARRVISHGVLGMLPKNKLRDIRMTRLKVFIGDNHPYADKLGK